MLATDNIIVRLLFSVVIYFLVGALIDTTIRDPKANELFKLILLVICIAIIFIGGLFKI